MNNKLIRIAVIVVVVLVVGAFVKDQVVKTIVTTAGSSVVGAPVSIRGFSLGILRPGVKIKDLKLYNPRGFPKGTLLDIPQITVGCDLGSIFKGKLHLTKMVLALKEATIIRDKDGNLNVDALKVAQKQEGQKEKAPEKAMPMQIDEATLSIGRVILKDFSLGEKPFIQVYDVGIKDRTYKNIGSAQQFISLVLVEAMKPAAIRNAAIYGAASLVGVAFLPAGIAATLTAKDSAEAAYDISFDKIYKTGLALLGDIGTIKTEDKEEGIIKAEIYSNEVTLKVEKSVAKAVRAIVTARKYLLPQEPVAAGVIYQLSERLR